MLSSDVRDVRGDDDDDAEVRNVGLASPQRLVACMVLVERIPVERIPVERIPVERIPVPSVAHIPVVERRLFVVDDEYRDDDDDRKYVEWYRDDDDGATYSSTELFYAYWRWNTNVITWEEKNQTTKNDLERNEEELYVETTSHTYMCSLFAQLRSDKADTHDDREGQGWLKDLFVVDSLRTMNIVIVRLHSRWIVNFIIDADSFVFSMFIQGI